jgi:hypothetical protein
MQGPNGLSDSDATSATLTARSAWFLGVPSRALALAASLAILLGATFALLLHARAHSPLALPAGAAAGPAVLPDAARGPISAAIGAAEPAYAFRAAPGGAVRAANPAQALRLEAGRSRISLQGAGLQTSLALRAAGYGSSLHAVGESTPTFVGNRATYTRAGLSEWYANGPLGVEQGFTLPRAPAAGSPGALTLVLGVSGDALPALAAGGKSVLLRAGHGRALRYGALTASDSRGTILHSWLTVSGRQLALHVDTAGARFPVRIDPTIEDEPEAKLTGGAEAGSGDKFGLSVALSADGNTALIGAPRASALAGAAWVFTRSAGGWKQQGPKLAGPVGAEVAACAATGDTGEEEELAAEPDECRFGRSVALSSDGNTALVGAPLAQGHAGAAWVFTRSGSSWSVAHVLSDPDPEFKSHFGAGVALSADGQTAMIGAPADHFYRGAAWVFSDSPSGWLQQAGPLTGGGEEGQGRFAQNVAISADGATAVIGAPSDASGGAAWIFADSGGAWGEASGKLTGAGAGAGADFGGAVALAADGATALIGARTSAEARGAAFVFAHTGAEWAEQGAPLTGSGEVGEEFGYSVGLSADGAKALVGASGHEGDRGAAWLYERSGTSWSAAQKQLEAGAQGSSSARFGSSVALAADAGTILVGGRRDSQSGAAWVFGPGPSVETATPNRGALAGGTTVTLAGNNLTGATAVHFGAAAAAQFTVLSNHSITAVTPPGEGSVAVRVTTPYGTSSGGPLFTYVRGKGGQGPPPEEGGGGAPGGSTSTTTLTPTSTITTPLSGVLGFTAHGGCAVALVSKSISVQRPARAAVRLRVSGTGRCAGKLRLRVTRRLSRHSLQVKTIGTAVFSIAAGRTGVVSVRLNAAGRRMLGTHHGRLSASLLLVRQSPAPALAQSARVRLARAAKHKRAHG